MASSQARSHSGQIDAARGLGNRCTILVADTTVERRQACGERSNASSSRRPRRRRHQPVKGDSPVPLQRLRKCLQTLDTPTASISTKRVLASVGVTSRSFQAEMVRAAASFHLLE